MHKIQFKSQIPCGTPLLLKSLAVAIFLAGSASPEIVFARDNNAGGNSKVGKACKITAGPNKGSKGTYGTDDEGNLWCETKSGKETECGIRKADGKDHCADAREFSGDPREEAPDDDKMAPISPQKPDLMVDSAVVLEDLVSRNNGFTYVPIELRIANAGSAKTTVPFHLESSYYDYKDDVGPRSLIVPNQIDSRLEPGEVLTVTVDVAVPFPNGVESPFSISVILDSCSSDDAGLDTRTCRIDEENERNNVVELDL